jgi:hypothetical protein
MIPAVSNYVEDTALVRHPYEMALFPPGSYRRVLDFQKQARELDGVSFVSDVLCTFAMEGAAASAAAAVNRVSQWGGLARGSAASSGRLTDRRRVVRKDIPPVIEKPQGLFRLIVRYPVLYYRLGLSWLVSRQVLLLTTTGRKTGLKRLVPVDYEEEDGTYYIIPNQGTHATWYRNLVAHPGVTIEVGRRRMGMQRPSTT